MPRTGASHPMAPESSTRSPQAPVHCWSSASRKSIQEANISYLPCHSFTGSSLRRTASSISSGTSSTGSSLLCYTRSGISPRACSTGSSCSSLSSLATSRGQPAPARSQADSCPACEVAHISQCSAGAAPESDKWLRQAGVDLRSRCTSLF